MPNWTKEQLDAITLSGKNIIVSAGAGSGKTAVLTERVIRKLQNCISINELLILTFTNAAAGEMKDRIRKAIKKDESLKEQLDYIDSAYITTFDSFSLSIVKKYHYLLNITNNPKIVDSALINMEKGKILENIFLSMYEKENKLFLKLINDLCVKKDDDIKKYIMNINNKLDLLSNKKEFLNNYMSLYFSNEKIDNDINIYVNYIKNNIASVKALIDDLSFYADGDFVTAISDLFEDLFLSNTYDEIKQNLNIKLPPRPRGSGEEIRVRKSEIDEALKRIKNLCLYKDIDEIKETILLSKSYVEIIIEIIKELDKEIKKYKLVNDLFEFNDIALMAIDVIKNNNNVRDEIRRSFNEILVDEYQDTNDLQEEFISLISDNNVYMVGDIKQSIYRFRNANPYIFKNKYDNYKNGLGGIKIDLKKNFRSRNEVLNNINNIFNIMMEDDFGGANYKESHQMIFGNDNYTKNKSSHDDNMDIYEYAYEKESKYERKEIEAFIVASDIKKKVESKYQILDKDKNELRDAKYSDFTILMDRVQAFATYKKIFEYNHIPLTLYKTEKITNEQDIIVLKNILLLAIKIKKKEYDEEFKYLFMSIGRSFLFNIDDADLFRINVENSFMATLLYKKVFNISKNLDNLSSDKVLENIIDEFDFYDKIITLGDVSDSVVRLRTLIDISSNLIGYNPYMFAEYLVELINNDEKIEFNVPIPDADSVKIMNIHKSKGLEFSVCYYTGLYKSFNMQDKNERFIIDNKYGIIAPYFKEGIGTTIYKELYKFKYNKEEISEKIRLFYVALTRAKEKMILVLPKVNIDIDSYYDFNKKINFKTFLDFLNMVKKNTEKYYKEIDIDDIGMTKNYIISNNNYLETLNQSDSILNVSDILIENGNLIEKSFSKKKNSLFTREENNNLKLGTKIHKYLELIDLKNPDLSIVKDSFIKTKIEHFLNNDILKNIQKAIVYQEYEFIYDNDDIEHGIIDLMLEYEDHIDIIDYKFRNILDEAYINQLNGYKNYISNLTKKNVNTYLYSIMNDEIKKV